MTLFEKIMKFFHDFFMPDAAPKTSTKVISSSIFSDINIDAIADELDIREKAMQDGKNEKPASDRVDLGETEKEIVARMNKFMDDAVSRVESQITNSAKDIQGKMDTLGQKAANIKNKASFAIESHNISEMFEYEKNAKEYYNNIQKYNSFKNKHNITRDAKYSTSGLAFWGPIALIFLLEVIINGILFSENSEYGVIGGILEIFLFSGVNIILGLATGFFYSISHYPKISQKIFGWILSLSSIASVLLFNIFTGHYRYLYVLYGQAEAIKNAFQSMLTSPILTDAYSIILCILGITFAFFASYKVYFKDDPIYGYGDLHRKLNESEDQEEITRTRLIDTLKKVHQEINKEIEDCRDEFKNSSLRGNSSITWASRSEQAYKAHINQVNDALTKLLKMYRTINEDTRITKAPSYFAKPVVLSGYSIVDHIKIMQNEVSEFNKKYDDALHEMENNQRIVASTLEKALSNIKEIQTKYSDEVISHE